MPTSEFLSHYSLILFRSGERYVRDKWIKSAYRSLRRCTTAHASTTKSSLPLRGSNPTPRRLMRVLMIAFVGRICPIWSPEREEKPARWRRLLFHWKRRFNGPHASSIRMPHLGFGIGFSRNILLYLLISKCVEHNSDRRQTLDQLVHC